MKLEMINYPELKVLGEVPLLLKLRMKKFMDKKSTNRGGVLVIDTCIIGDFLATLPALRTFIRNQDKEVDLVVTPPLKTLAEGIRGVRKVYTAKSIYERVNELSDLTEQLPHSYDEVKVLRISPETYKMLKTINYSNLGIYDIPFYKYGAHLVKNNILNQGVKQFSEVNFEMIGVEQPTKRLEFNDIFHFNDADYVNVRELPEMSGTKKKVLIHTGAGWNVKLWDNDKWVEVIKHIHALGEYKCILVGRSDFEAQSVEYIQNKLDFRVHSLVNKIDLKTTLLVMRKSDYFIGIDSGPRNLAHLADLRSISLLGPAPKNFMPVSKEDIVINKFNCKCKSLYYLHKESAMQHITSNEVFDAFKQLAKIDSTVGEYLV